MNRFKSLTVSFSDPGLFESDDAIADATEVYGEIDKDFPEIDTPCDKSPSDQCEYDALRDPERCIHCGRRTG